MKTSVVLLVVNILPLLVSHSIVKRQEEGGGSTASREIEPGIYAFTSNGAYISMFIITSDGVMVIDPMNVDHSRAMLAEIRTISQAPIKYLFYSHNHYDHAKGGQVWKDEGATIVAHVDAADWQKEFPSEDLVLPDKTWSGDQFNVSLGGTTLELRSAGVSHGLGMTTFVLPQEKVGYIADLATPNQVIFFFMPDFNIPGLKKSLQDYSRLNVDKIVFSHSANPDPLEPVTQDVTRFYVQYLEDIQNAVKVELRAGTGPFQIPAKIDLPQYRDLAFYDLWFTQNVEAAVVNEVLGPQSWHRVTKSASIPQLNTKTTVSTNTNTKSSFGPSKPSLPTYSWKGMSHGIGSSGSSSYQPTSKHNTNMWAQNG